MLNYEPIMHFIFNIFYAFLLNTTNYAVPDLEKLNLTILSIMNNTFIAMLML